MSYCNRVKLKAKRSSSEKNDEDNLEADLKNVFKRKNNGRRENSSYGKNTAKNRMVALKERLKKELESDASTIIKLQTSSNIKVVDNLNRERLQKRRCSQPTINDRLKRAKTKNTVQDEQTVKVSTSSIVNDTYNERLQRIKSRNDVQISQNTICSSSQLDKIHGTHPDRFSQEYFVISENHDTNVQIQIVNRNHETVSCGDTKNKPQMGGGLSSRLNIFNQANTNQDSLVTNHLMEDNEAIVNNRDSTFTDEDDPMDCDIEENIVSNLEVANKENAICLVADTNIFIHYLHKIKDILNFTVSGSQNVKVFIPWMVITELDYIKESRDKANKEALAAAKFINHHLQQSNSKIIGQTVVDAVIQRDIGISPDDKILASTMQAAEKYSTVILLTNDVNLRNKALINNIEASSPTQILQKLLFKLKRNVKSSKIAQALASICTQVICQYCKRTFGEDWSKMDMLQGAPWDLMACLKIMIKYWKDVFRGKMLKQCLPTLDTLHAVLDENAGHICDDSDAFQDFMKKTLSLLVFLKDLPEFKNMVNQTIETVIQTASI